MLIALALALHPQEIIDYRYLPLQIKDYEIPVIAGQKEMVLGIGPQRSETYGFFINELEAKNYSRPPINYSDVRSGYSSWSVGNSVFGSESGFALESKAYRIQEIEWKQQIVRMKHFGNRTWYLDKTGKILGETCVMKMATGTWTMDVKYGTDDYTVTFSSPGKPTKTQTITPGCTMDELTVMPFKPMLRVKGSDVEPEVLMREKEFYLLDPFTVAPQKFKATLMSTFHADIFGRKWNGRQIELKGGYETQTAWISNEGVLMKLVMPRGRYLTIENNPASNIGG